MSEKINFHLYLGKKDYEILVWKNSLPPKCFKYFVEQILLSHINGYKIILPPILIEENSNIVTGKPIHIVTENRQIIDFLSKIENGDKSKFVKEIILYYIRESRDSFMVSDNKKKKKKTTSTPQYFTKPESTNSRSNDKKDRDINIGQNIKQNNTVMQQLQKPVTQITQSTTSETELIKETEQKQKVSNKSPMMQALFKMSGDE
jgi:predicted DNA-binding protein